MGSKKVGKVESKKVSDFDFEKELQKFFENQQSSKNDKALSQRASATAGVKRKTQNTRRDEMKKTTSTAPVAETTRQPAVWKTRLFWILTIIAILSVVSSSLIFWLVDRTRMADSAGMYIVNADDTITLLDEHDIIEPSPFAEVLSQAFTINASGLQADEGTNISPFSSLNIQTMSVSGLTALGFTVMSEDPSTKSHDYMQFYVNGQYHTNYSPSVQLNFNTTTGFNAEIAKSFQDTYEGEGDVYYDYRICIEMAGTWYISPKMPSFVQGSTTERQSFDFSSLSSGTYKICGFYYFGNSPTSLNTLRSTNVYTIAFNAVNYVPLPNAPDKEGYTFVGWYFDSNLTQPVTAFEVVEGTVLHAKYKINRHTIVFTTNQGSTINSITVDWGTTVNLDTYISTRTGYDFKGWFTDASFTTAAQTSLLVKSDYNLHAKWEIKKLNITLMVEGEVWQVITVDYGTGVSAIVSEIESTSVFNITSFTTGGIVYDSASETAAVFADSVLSLSEKPLSEQIKDFDLGDWLLWGGIVPIGTILIIFAIVFLIKSAGKKAEERAVQAALASATKRKKGGK